MDYQRYLEPVEKSAIQGAVTALATGLYYGMDQRANIPLVGTTNLTYIAFGVGAVASIVNDIVHKFVFEEIHVSKKAEDQASMVLAAGLGAVIYNYSLCAINPNLCRDTGIVTNSFIGGGSEIAGSLIYNLLKG